MNIDKFRKLVEAVFCGGTQKVVIYTTEKLEGRKEKERPTYALVVENSLEEYNSTLKNVKRALTDGNVNYGILGMRSTKQGKLLITMEKNEEVRRNVQELLRSDKVMDKKITSLEDRDMETIFIRGLDAVADKDDVTKAIEYYIKDIRHKYFKMRIKTYVKQQTDCHCHPNQEGRSTVAGE